jgi:genome maintenance exonuclease 1
MLIERYNYAPINRKTIDGKRHYATPDGSAVPSVTTILDKTKSKEKMQALNAWKKRVGEAKAQQIVTEAAGRGTRLHKWLEDYVMSGKIGDPGSNPYSQQSHKMASLILEHGLKNADEFWGTEVPLYYSGLYAGTTDLVGVHAGEPAIMDFKQTNKPKKTEWVEDYFLQLCAYAHAHNNMFETTINKGVILMCSKDYQYQEWILEGTAFDHYSNIWFDRVAQYYEYNT